MTKFVTVEEVAEMADEDTRQVSKAISDGTLPAARFALSTVDKDAARKFWRDSGGGTVDWPTGKYWTFADLAECWGVPVEQLEMREIAQGTKHPSVLLSLLTTTAKLRRITRADAEAYAGRVRWLTLADAADRIGCDPERVRLAALVGLVEWRREGKRPEFASTSLDAYADQGMPAPDTSNLVALASGHRKIHDSLGLPKRGRYPWLDTPDCTGRRNVITLNEVDRALEGSTRAAASLCKKLGLSEYVDTRLSRCSPTQLAEGLAKWRDEVSLPDFGESNGGVLDKLKQKISKAS